MPRALIVYAGRAGETNAIGNLIAEGVRISGAEVEVKDRPKGGQYGQYTPALPWFQ